MSNYYAGNADNQGVHINSGIPNRAFYLAAVSLGGYAWEKAGLIWYRTLGRLRPTAQFADAARSTISVASELYGSNSAEAAAVQDAWTQVGVLGATVP
jgi:Zn-dependent metalloprotease